MNDQSGQVVNAKIVTGIVAIVIILFVGVMITTDIYEEASDAAAEDRELFENDNTPNSDMGNYLEPLENWENYQENLTAHADANNWMANDNGDNYVVRCEDNEPGFDNGIFFSGLQMSDLRDGVSKATVVFKYCVVDNDNASSIIIHVQLSTSTENFTLYHENKANENGTTFTEVENDITNLITWATGENYQLYVRTEFERHSEPVENSDVGELEVHYDNVRLYIETYNEDYAEQAVEAVAGKVPTVITLLAVLAIILVAAAIMKLVGMI